MKTRLIALFLVPLVAILLLLGGAYAWTSARGVAQEFTNQQLDDLNYFLVSARQALTTGNTKILAGEMARYSELYGTQITVYDRSGSRLVARGSQPGTNPGSRPGEYLAPKELTAQIDLALSGRRSEAVPPALPWATGTDTVVEPVYADGRVIGAVSISAGLEGPRAQVVTQWLVLAAAGLVLIVVFIFVILRLVRWVLRPMLRVDHAMAAIEQGEINARIADDTGPPEMQRMIRMFNSMADEIERVIVRQQEFAMNASHELRNPLGALLLRVEYLATGLDETWEPDVEKTREEGQRMARILDTLLTMARTQRRDVALAPVDLGEVARDRVAAWRDVANERGIRFNVRAGERPGAPPRPVRVVTDRTSIESALDGVIDNALKFAPHASTIEVTAAYGEGRCVLSVRDHGPGLTEDEISHVTERFWRSTRDQNVAGSGLGLAIASDLLRALGGSVTVTSPTGGGLEVSLLLPETAPSGGTQ
ncbi:sensor histidine kinase [Leucobacter salsicius]|uniref:sensor histidine kinase n=1 Tax=Leucobacter salsicius TaxID=664638 RepID=UPI000348E10E|nr:HAMP domain-containing sensor histidine kinase [Leucobacter salsicius]